MIREKKNQKPKIEMSKRDVEFAKETLSRFVNGEMGSAKDVAAQMSRDHRYLQQEMFKICYEYIRILAMNHGHGRYDGRNEWACETAAKMLAADPGLAIRRGEWDELQERLSRIAAGG